jgi:hypothetical protein
MILCFSFQPTNSATLRPQTVELVRTLSVTGVTSDITVNIEHKLQSKSDVYGWSTSDQRIWFFGRPGVNVKKHFLFVDWQNNVIFVLLSVFKPSLSRHSEKWSTTQKPATKTSTSNFKSFYFLVVFWFMIFAHCLILKWPICLGCSTQAASGLTLKYYTILKNVPGFMQLGFNLVTDKSPVQYWFIFRQCKVLIHREMTRHQAWLKVAAEWVCD